MKEQLLNLLGTISLIDVSMGDNLDKESKFQAIELVREMIKQLEEGE